MWFLLCPVKLSIYLELTAVHVKQPIDITYRNQTDSHGYKTDMKFSHSVAGLFTKDILLVLFVQRDKWKKFP